MTQILNFIEEMKQLFFYAIPYFFKHRRNSLQIFGHKLVHRTISVFFFSVKIHLLFKNHYCSSICIRKSNAMILLISLKSG